MPAALRASAKGARVISAGIHMSEIPAFSYELLWEERTLGSVANLTRARRRGVHASWRRGVPVRTEVEDLPAGGSPNEALESTSAAGRLRGAARRCKV